METKIEQWKRKYMSSQKPSRIRKWDVKKDLTKEIIETMNAIVSSLERSLEIQDLQELTIKRLKKRIEKGDFPVSRPRKTKGSEK